MSPSTLKNITKLRSNSIPLALIVDLDGGRERVVSEDQIVPLVGALGDALRDALISGKASTEVIAGQRYFVLPILA
ncbi:MAG: hypothetical protein AAFR13_00165 [Pseudomonadota bacterium]